MVEERALILRALLGGEYVSGEEISRRLGVSRAMVHKLIAAMRDEGLSIEARPRRGYRLVELPDRPLSWALAALWPQDAGHPVRFVREVSSTMELASAWAREGAAAGSVVATDHQVAGRGRRGRPWDEIPGESLLASIVLRPCIPAARAGWLPLAAAVGAAEAVLAVAGVAVGIKWPNDLLFGGRKLAGILVELTLDEQDIRHAIVGCGINVHQKTFPAELASRAVSLRQAAGFEGSRAVLLAALVREVMTSVKQLETDAAGLRRRWFARNVTIGQRVSVQAPGGLVQGDALDVDEFARLVVRTDDGEVHALAAGDVSLGGAQDSPGGV